MGSSLDHPGHGVLKAPLPFKSPMFISFTDGAYSLSFSFIRGDCLVKLVSVFAMGLARVNRRYRVAVSKRVFSYCCKRKMLMINAPRVSTDVVDYHPIWYCSTMNEPRYAMGAPASFSEVKCPIPVFVERTLPSVTSVFHNLILITKTEIFAFCQNAIHAILLVGLRNLSIPQGPTGAKGMVLSS